MIIEPRHEKTCFLHLCICKIKGVHYSVPTLLSVAGIEATNSRTQAETRYVRKTALDLNWIRQLVEMQSNQNPQCLSLNACIFGTDTYYFVNFITSAEPASVHASVCVCVRSHLQT